MWSSRITSYNVCYTKLLRAKVQDRFAEALLLTLIEEGPKAFAKPQDYDVWANIIRITSYNVCYTKLLRNIN